MNHQKQEADARADEEVSKLIVHVEPEELHQFLAAYAGGNKKFRNDLLAHFRKHEPQKTLAHYRTAAAACFNFSGTSRYRSGYDFYNAACEAGSALTNLLEKGKYLASQDKFVEAAAIAQSIIETIPRNYEVVDDSYGNLADLFHDAVGLLLTLAESEQPERKLKQDILHWVGTEVKEKVYGDYGFDEIASLVIPYTLATGRMNEALDIAEERIELAGSDYELETATMDKILLLQKAGLVNEAEITINEGLNFNNIRSLKVDMLLMQDHHTAAIGLIKEGIRLAKEKNLPGLVDNWEDRLLDVYIALKARDKVVKLAEDLFCHGNDTMKYYHILKKETLSKDWPAFLETLISKSKHARTGSHYCLPQIYIEEKYWDRLLDHVKDRNLRTLMEYEKLLKPHFPAKVSALLVEKVSDYADRNLGRKHYEYVAGIIGKLRSYPHGNGLADKLLVEFRAKYRVRRAMMEELNGV